MTARPDLARPRQAGSVPFAQSQFQALVRLAILVRDRPTADVLAAVGEAVRASCGYATVVVNAYEPGEDRYVVAAVSGSAAAHVALEGTSNRREDVHETLLRPEYEIGDGVFLVPGDHATWETMTSYVPYAREPDECDGADPRRWRAADALLIVLQTSEGRPLGFISVDEPVTGLRPTGDDVAPMVAMATHAAATIEGSQANAEAERHSRALNGLLAFSTTPPTGGDPAIAQRACEIATTDLGYGSAAVLYGRRGRLELAAGVGWRFGEADAIELSPQLSEVFIGGSVDADGCAFISGDLSDPRSGSGPFAWGIGRLAVRLRQPGGPALGVLVVDRPHDLLEPTARRRLELRLLADQIVATSIAHRQHRDLERLASQDPLTGLPNRRAFEDAVDVPLRSRQPTALVMFDLDHFKSVNDLHGHDEGDRVLCRFARLLTEVLPPNGCAGRLGGEEFCVALWGAAVDDAEQLADLIRRRSVRATAGHAPGVTVSAGVARCGTERTTRRALTKAADAALYIAKNNGRDRVEQAAGR